MLRSASRKAFAFREATTTAATGRASRLAFVGRSPAKIPLPAYRCNSDGAKFFTTSSTFSEDSFPPIPQPLPAVAYDYLDDKYDDETFEAATPSPTVSHGVNNVFGSSDVKGLSRRNPTGATVGSRDANFNEQLDPFTASAANGGNGSDGPTTTSRPYPSPTDTDGSSKGSISYRKAGGGGGGGGGTGRHRCPKCGTTVTFRCDFEENTFYCASCSGWFVASPDTIDATSANEDGSSYEEFLAKNNGHNKQTTAGAGGAAADPEILMRHVSSGGCMMAMAGGLLDAMK